MPPTGEEQNHVQYAMLENELAAQMADAELFVRTLEDRAKEEGRVLTGDERNLAQKILNAPAERVIPMESAKLRSFLNHIEPKEWARFNTLAAAVAEDREDEAEVAYFVDLYHNFCAEYDEWVKSWIGTLDPDTLTALSDALADKDNPEALVTVQHITESLVLRRERQIDRIEE